MSGEMDSAFTLGEKVCHATVPSPRPPECCTFQSQMPSVWMHLSPFSATLVVLA